jgi:Ca2+-binding RTX toxin-like protein
VGDDLEISVIGSDDAFTVDDWYLGAGHHVEQFRAGDGKLLLDGQVQALVEAMAGFSPPPAGQTMLPASLQSSLSPLIAANWH